MEDEIIYVACISRMVRQNDANVIKYAKTDCTTTIACLILIIQHIFCITSV